MLTNIPSGTYHSHMPEIYCETSNVQYEIDLIGSGACKIAGLRSGSDIISSFITTNFVNS
jgi:hypothetical protein